MKSVDFKEPTGALSSFEVEGLPRSLVKDRSSSEEDEVAEIIYLLGVLV